MDVSALPDELRSCLGRVDRFHQPPQGDAAELVLVEAAAGRFAVKRARGVTGAAWLRREYEALRALGGTALPARVSTRRFATRRATTTLAGNSNRFPDGEQS